MYNNLMASGLPSSKSASKNRAHTGLIRHGKPLFPLGLYLGQVEPDDLKTIGASKFNMIMPCAITDSPLSSARLCSRLSLWCRMLSVVPQASR